MLRMMIKWEKLRQNYYLLPYIMESVDSVEDQISVVRRQPFVAVKGWSRVFVRGKK